VSSVEVNFFLIAYASPTCPAGCRCSHW